MFKDGKRCGQGKMTYVKVDELYGDKEFSDYAGEWRLNLRHGYGVMTWADGSCFKGQWHMDKRTEGLMNIPDGTFYQGSFKDDMFHGKGKITLLNKSEFSGIFEVGKCPNFGVMRYEDGKIYVGVMK